MTFLDTFFDPRLIVSFLIARIVLKRFLRFEAEVVIGTFVYFLLLVVRRLTVTTGRLGLKSWQAARKVNVPLPQKKMVVTSVLDINSVYQLNGLEVILGFDRTGRPVRFDLDRYHTLLAGVSGAGKTVAINGLIAQLITRPGFRENYDIYLLDLKSSKEDYLALWRPVLAGYYAIDERGSSEAAIAALDTIAETMHRNTSNKRILLIVDELAMLTTQSTDIELRKRGHAIMQRLAAQLRDRGAIFAATQRPHYEVVSRGVTSQLERKICLRVDDNDTAKMILRFKPETNCVDLRDGEFVLKEPGARKREQIGRTLLMKLPQEIDIAVGQLIELTAENDDRLKVFKLAAGTLSSGDSLPGVRREMWKSAGYNIEYLRTCYKNFAGAGAVVADVDKRGQPNRYLLSSDFGEAFRLVAEYIGTGKWESAPETIGKNGHATE